MSISPESLQPRYMPEQESIIQKVSEEYLPEITVRDQTFDVAERRANGRSLVLDISVTGEDKFGLFKEALASLSKYAQNYRFSIVGSHDDAHHAAHSSAFVGEYLVLSPETDPQKIIGDPKKGLRRIEALDVLVFMLPEQNSLPLLQAALDLGRKGQSLVVVVSDANAFTGEQADSAERLNRKMIQTAISSRIGDGMGINLR